MNTSQIETVLKHLTIAVSQLEDCDNVVYNEEIAKIQQVRDTVMHLEFYCPEKAKKNLKKKFIATWGDGYETQGIKIVDVDFFNWENGYDGNAMLKIQNLTVDEEISFPEAGIHYVRRTE